MSCFVQVPTGPDPRVERRSAHFGEPLPPERRGVARAISLGLKFVCGSRRPRSLSPSVTLEKSEREAPSLATLKEPRGRDRRKRSLIIPGSGICGDGNVALTWEIICSKCRFNGEERGGLADRHDGAFASYQDWKATLDVFFFLCVR